MALEDAVIVIRDAGFSTTGKLASSVIDGQSKPDAGYLEGELNVSPEMFAVSSTTAYIQVTASVRNGRLEVTRVHASLSTVSL